MNLSKEVKYLGVIVDDKLTWKAHVRAQVKKGPRALWSYEVFIGSAWELLPKMTLWLYQCVIIHKITYVAAACWDIVDIGKVRMGTSLEGCTHYDHRGNENNSDKSTGNALGSANTWNGGRVCRTMVAYRLPRSDPRNLGIGHNRIYAKAYKVDSKFSMINPAAHFW